MRVPERHGHAAKSRERWRIAAHTRLYSTIHGEARPDRVHHPGVDGCVRPAVRLLA
jgi:hypothetical protein